MMGTPELRALALDHFHEQKDELAVALAERLGEPPDALAPNVLAGVVGTAMWAMVDRWVAEGGKRDRLRPMLDEVFDLLATGFDPKTTTTASA